MVVVGGVCREIEAAGSSVGDCGVQGRKIERSGAMVVDRR